MFASNLIPYAMENRYNKLQRTNIILTCNLRKISGRRLWGVNYYSVGKKLAEDLKVLFSSL